MEEAKRLASQIRKLLKYNTFRRIIQTLCFMLFSAIIFNISASPLLLPVQWTWGLSQNVIGDAFTAIQLLFYNAIFPWLALASFLITGVLIGRSLCGWICPFGFIQDLIGFIKRKQTDISSRTHEFLIYAKYVVLGITFFISATFAATKLMGVSGGYEDSLGIFVKVPFTAFSPAETLFATLPKMMLDFRLALVDRTVYEALSGIFGLSPLFWIQFTILVFVLVFVAYVPRGWCRYFCPHGAIMAVLNRFSFLGLRRDPVKCAKGGCRLCVAACPMRVPILDLPWEKFSHPECIYCMKCADVCQDKAIKLKYP
jgi:ferredoxin-type protein NapH